MAPTPSNGTSLRVLVVEDHKDACDSLCILLRLWGHAAEASVGGAAALTTGPTFRPDVVLMDIGMPEMDGYETLRRMRELPELGAPLFVAMTGYGREDDRRRASDAGFTHYLLKPVEPEELQALLARIAACGCMAGAV
jgi:CheY-like chemotaxis protein